MSPKWRGGLYRGSRGRSRRTAGRGLLGTRSAGYIEKIGVSRPAAALSRRHKVLVRTVVLLLRRDADGPHLTGEYLRRFDDEAEDYLIFRYRVVRVWRVPLETLLTGGLGTLPLAPLSDEAAPQLGDAVRRIDERLRAEASPETADKLRLASLILMGLRYSPQQAVELWKGVTHMHESSTYQYILREGELAGVRRLLLRLGQKHLGVPDTPTRAALEAISDVPRLEELVERVYDVKTWAELLASPSP